METSSENANIVVDLNQIAWKRSRSYRSYQFRVCLDGGADGPEAMQVLLPGMDVPPHFHHASQFQLLLDGSMQFSDPRMEAITVHYTDHDVPDASVKPDAEHSMLILYVKPGGYSPMSDKEARKLINGRGREIEGCARGRPNLGSRSRWRFTQDPGIGSERRVRPDYRMSRGCGLSRRSAGLWPLPVAARRFRDHRRQAFGCAKPALRAGQRA